MKVAVIGAGTMGSGIAQLAATHDHEVVLYDMDRATLDTANHKLNKILNRLIEKGRIDQAKKESILCKIQHTDSLDKISGSQLVIEAIIENLDIKKSVFQNIEKLVDESCIVASNTSSLSITALASALSKPERFIGIHFFNPAPIMKLVEIIPAIQTDQETTTKSFDIIESWGKTCVKTKDTPGFIVNKVARPFYSEALRIYEEGIADFATIDWAMKEIAGFRMGPFELMDFIGNDVNYAVTESVFSAFYYDPRYKPAFTQKRLSEAGFLGRKTKRGYYNYSEEMPSPQMDKELGIHIAQRVIIMLINEAADTLQFGIANKEDIDLAMTKGVNYPKGLFKWADDIGIENCVQHMDNLYELYREDRYRCAAILRLMKKNNQRFYND